MAGGDRSQGAHLPGACRDRAAERRKGLSGDYEGVPADLVGLLDGTKASALGWHGAGARGLQGMLGLGLLLCWAAAGLLLGRCAL